MTNPPASQTSQRVWCRHFTLPTVCRGWAAVCDAPSALWSDVDADVREYSAHYGCTVNATLLRGWLAKRAATIKTLNLRWAALGVEFKLLLFSLCAVCAALRPWRLRVPLSA